MSRKTISRTIAVFIVTICLLSSALAGVILYTLTKQSTWKVNVAYGLVLTDQNDIPVTTLDFVVDRYGTQVKTFKIKNTSNNAVNVTQIMPSSTAYYSFATTYVNSTIAKDGNVLFTISLTDLNMNAELLYTGQFDWKIVDSFPKADDIPEPKIWFEASEIVYADDTSPYLSFVSESFDKPQYNLSETVQYSFTTKNINQTNTIDSFSYNIDVYKSGIFQYQVFTGMNDTEPDLQPNETVTIPHSFSAPSLNGSYCLKLTYTGHNSELIRVYTFTITEIECYRSDIMNVVVTGFTSPNSLSSIRFQIKNTDTTNGHRFNYEVKILETGYVIKTGDTSTVGDGETWTSGTYSFTSPSAYGAYTIQITTW
jgi:hypothetical protein